MRLIYGLLFAFVLMSDAMWFIPGINYWDEIAIVVAPICALIYAKWELKWNRNRLFPACILIILLVIGMFNNIVFSDIQQSNVAIFKDILAFIKFPVVMLSLSIIGESYAFYPEKQRCAVEVAALVSKGFILCAFFGVIIGKICDIGFYTSEVRIFRTYQFMYSHPTFLVSALVMAIAVLYANGIVKNRAFILGACVPLFMAQRFKGYAVIAFVLFTVIVKERHLKRLFKIKKTTKINANYVIPTAIAGAVIIFFIFIEKFQKYLLWGMTSARIALYVIGFKILIDFFPLGSGFGTFASYLSGEYYSSIYYLYKINEVDGLRPDKYNYIADTYWPWIYGQLGILGAVGYTILIFNLIKRQFCHVKNYNFIMAFLLMWFYILLACCMEAYLTNTSAIAAAIVLNVFLGMDSN